MELQQLIMDIRILLLTEISWTKGNNCCFTDSTKTINIDVHSDFHGPIWFTLDVMIDIAEVSGLIGVQEAFTAFWDRVSHNLQETQKILRQPSHNVFSRFELILVLSWDLLVWCTSYLFCLVRSIFTGENYGWLALRHLATDFFQTWYNDRDYETCDTSLSNLDLHSWSQLHEKSTTSALISSQIS